MTFLVRSMSSSAAADTDAWMNAPVSSRSRFGDDLWHLDIFTAGCKPTSKRLRWDLPLPKGAQITSAQHAGLIRAAKQYLWSMVLHPPDGRGRWSPFTLRGNGQMLLVLIAWMAVEGVTSFRDISPRTTERLVAWLRSRPGRKGDLSPSTVRNYLNVIHTIFLQRAKLEDAPAVNPLRDETPLEAAGVSAATMGSIPYIPDAVAVDLLSKALAWVEDYSVGIIAAAELRWRTVARLRADGWHHGRIARAVVNALRHAAVAGPDGRPIACSRAALKCVTQLSTACFVVIAGFVGMRISEILSMQIGAVERHPIGETGVEQAYVSARLFKGSGEPLGRPELWVVPEPVERAVECLERLRTVLRADADGTDLFVAIAGIEAYVSDAAVTGAAVTQRLQAFARDVGVPLHEGKVWPLSPHQFRKTFARFVARGDRSNLLRLAAHFKHVSVAMTSRGYIGTDFELHELIDEESRAETAQALDRLLSSDRLGGRMGERIVTRNHAFRGRAGEQVRRDYIRFVLAETDLRVRGCDYGWCVFQAETAQCGGEVAPNEARRGPSVCAKCSNLAVDDRHVAYWQDRRHKNLALWDRASPLARAVLAEAIEECDRMLRRIEEGRDDGQAEPDAPAPDDDAG